MGTAGGEGPTVALLPWGDVIEDFLDPLGVDFEAFRTEMTGGWMFGYLTALRAAGSEPVLVCVSRGVRTRTSTIHEPTGVAMEVVPPTRAFRLAQRVLRPLLARRVRAAEGVTAYLATPPLRLHRVLRARRCAVVLCQEYEAPRFDVCVLLGMLTGRRVFATYQGGHETRPGRWGRWIERPIRRRAIPHAQGLVIASGAEARRVRSVYGIPAHRIAPIPNPVDPPKPMRRADARRALGLPLDAAIVAWHGRVQIRRKGLDVLLQAWDELRAARPAASLLLLLVGSGADDDVLRDRLGGRPDVRWIDEYVHDRERIYAALASADVYAFASPHEGFAVAPIEAMAMAVPVVATAAPGIDDLLPAGAASGGVVVPVGDATALASAIGTLLDDPQGATAIGSAGRARVETALSLEAVGASLRAFLVPDP